MQRYWNDVIGTWTGRPLLVAVATTAALATVLALSGCAALETIRGGGLTSPSEPAGPSLVEQARAQLATGNLDGADLLIVQAMAPPERDWKGDFPEGSVPGSDQMAELLSLRAEIRLRQGRYPEAEADALSAMALVPATAEVSVAASPSRPSLTQRAIHLRLAELYENAGLDDNADQQLLEARTLCQADAILTESGACNLERKALVRIRVSRGLYAEAEPLVLEEISTVQSRYGADDIRLSIALCHAAGFYARQGSYALSGPLYARSLDLWTTVREEARTEHTRAVAAGEPSPFSAEFLKPSAGNFPFTAPCGLEDQPGILYKLGKAPVAHDATRLEQKLWESDAEAGTSALLNLDTLVARNADPLEVAAARHAVAFVALRKGDLQRTELELRLGTEAYQSVWATLPRSERRYRTADYLMALESLSELLRASKRFSEATATGERASEIAIGGVDAYDGQRLDTLLSLAKTAREMREPISAEAAAVRYLDAVVAARGDTSSDYAWALRTLSYAYLLRGQLDASERMDMQARAIWAKQNIVAPAY